MFNVNFDIIAHRGYWKKSSEQNSMSSFELALKKGYGIETDLRDAKCQIVISHDAYSTESPSFEKFCQLYKEIGRAGPLALNIKADGILPKLKDILAEYSIENYFIFDMSIPETLRATREGLRFYSRISEYEVQDAFANHSQGIWFDSFDGQMNLSEKQLALYQNKTFCIVSRELHRQNDYPRQWKSLKKLDPRRIQICTDFPDLAKEFFHG